MADLPPGVRGLDHTADLGIEVRAPTLDDLFHRAAAGMAALIIGADEEAQVAPAVGRPALTPHRVRLEAGDAARLLALWLREVLWIHQDTGALYAGARFEVLDETRLDARVDADPDPPAPVRELKGVTYHELAVERRPDGWYARVIFDV